MKKKHRSIKSRLLPNEAQAETFLQWIGVSRFIYNEFLNHRICYYAFAGETLSEYDQCNVLAQYRKNIDWIEAVPSVVARGAVIHLDRAYKSFLKGEKRHPKFKAKYYSKWSCSIVGNFDRIHFRRKTNRIWEIKLPKIGWVEYRHSRNLPDEAKITKITIKYEHDRWWVNIAYKFDWEDQPIKKKEAVGGDRGCKVTLMTSDGIAYDMPDTSKKEKRIETLQKVRSRQKMTKDGQGYKQPSNQREKTNRKIRNQHFKIGNVRNDFCHKTTTELTQNYHLICIEDLNTVGMSKSNKGTVENPGKNRSQKKGLNRSIRSNCWGRIEQMLGYKADSLIKVNPAYTSQMCSNCGHTDKLNRQSQSEFKCTNCGHTQNADINAARNILLAGQVAIEKGRTERLGSV